MDFRKLDNCKSCIWEDKCRCEDGCDNYYSLEDEMSDEYIYDVVEEARIEYGKAWSGYVRKYMYY